MADTIEIIEGTATVVEVAGPSGPQGPQGPKGDPGDVSGSVAWDNVTGKPATFTPSAHTHELDELDASGATDGYVLTAVGDGTAAWEAATGGVTSVTGTAPIVSSGGTTPAISISAATAEAAGSMSAADKTKLDGIAAGAEVNVNADWNASSGDAQIINKPTLGGAAALDVGNTTGTVAAGDDARLSDSRTPTAHTHVSADITDATNAATANAIALRDGTGGAQFGGSLDAVDIYASGIVDAYDLRENGFTLASKYAAISHTHLLADLSSTGASASEILVADGIGGASWQASYTHPNHTGDVTSSGDGATTIANGAVTYAKIQNVSATDKLLGRSTAGAGVVEEITCTAAGRALLDDADASAQRTTLGLGTAAVANLGTGASDAAYGNHTHGNITNGGLVGTVANLPLKTGTGGIVEAGAFGVNAGEFAEGNHTHADLHTRSHAITSTSDHTAGNHKVFYSDGSGNVQELALGNSGEVLTSNGATSSPSFAAASGGVTGAAASASDVLGVSGSDITGVDANADRIVFWDDSASALKYLEAGSGLTISGTVMTASGGASINQAIAVGFVLN